MKLKKINCYKTKKLLAIPEVDLGRAKKIRTPSKNASFIWLKQKYKNYIKTKRKATCFLGYLERQDLFF